MMLIKRLSPPEETPTRNPPQSPSKIYEAGCDATVSDHQSYIAQLNEKLCEQERQLTEKDDKIEELNRQLELEKFEVRKFMYVDKLLEHYTGFPSFQTLQVFFDFIKPTASNMRVMYYQGESCLSIPNNSHSFPLFDELFMFLVRIKLGSSEVDLSVKFNCHVSTISRRALTWCSYLYFVLGSIHIWPPADRIKLGSSEVDLSVKFNCHVSTISRRALTWCNYLYFVLGSIHIWPPADRIKLGSSEVDLSVKFNCHVSTISRRALTWCNYLYFVFGSIHIWPPADVVLEIMPEDVRLLYPRTRVIIDCTEMYTERPSSVHLGSQMYSHYKSRNTWKGLVGIAPNGTLTFVSAMFSGCMSDTEITKLCGLLGLLKPGDVIVGDKGFLIGKLLEGTGVSINTPHFLSSAGQFEQTEIEENQQISSHRIHTERHIKRVK